MTYLRQLRAHQWVKNLLLFVPIVTAHKIDDLAKLRSACLAFVAFSLCASAMYVLNDVLDLPTDRHHPRKKKRPLASGKLSILAACFMIFLFATLGISVGLHLSKSFLWVLLGYISVTVLYSLVLKEIALLDVLILAGLYSIRVFAGSAATDIPISEWLLAFSMFCFLSLALAKRFAELKLLSSHEMKIGTRRGYFPEDIEYIPVMGICSGFLTSLVMALYISSDRVKSLYEHPAFLWLICPLILYWIGRVWLLCHRGKMLDDPVVFALKDPVSYGVAASALLIMVLST